MYRSTIGIALSRLTVGQVLLSVEYQPTDRPTVNRDSISSVSAVYR